MNSKQPAGLVGLGCNRVQEGLLENVSQSSGVAFGHRMRAVE